VDYQFEEDGQRFGGIQKGEPVQIPYEPGGNLLMREANAFLTAVRQRDTALLPNNGRSGERIIQLLADVQELLLKQEIAIPAFV